MARKCLLIRTEPPRCLLLRRQSSLFTSGSTENVKLNAFVPATIQVAHHCVESHSLARLLERLKNESRERGD